MSSFWTKIQYVNGMFRNKLRYQIDLYRKRVQKEEGENFTKVDAIYIDGKKDATLVMLKGNNEKFYHSVQIEEHYAIVGEPGKKFPLHFSP